MSFTIPNPEITVADCDVEVNPITAHTASGGNRDFRVGVAQPLVIPGDAQSNVRNMEPLVIEAARRNAKLLVFSECGITGYDLKRAGAHAAITLEDPVLNQIAHMARKHEIAIVTGFYEKRGENLFINRTGEVTAVIPSNMVFELLRPELAVGVITPRRKETKE
jgi:hypothetical protein